MVHLGNLTAVRKLISEGVDVNAEDIRERTALFYAASSAGKSTTYLFYSGSFPLESLFFSFSDNVNVVRALIQLGANVNVEDRDELTPLFWAVFNGESFIYRHQIKPKIYYSFVLVSLPLQAMRRQSVCLSNWARL